MAYILFQKYHIYKSALNRWDEKTLPEKIWDAFKTHVCQAFKALHRTEALTIQETMNRDQVMNMVSEELQTVMGAFQPPPPLYHPQVTEEQQEATPSLFSSDIGYSSNSTVSDLTIQTLQRQMEMMQSMMSQMNQMNNNNSSNNYNRNIRSNGGRNPNQSKYCWIHGQHSHTGRECRVKADRRKDEATIKKSYGRKYKKNL